ncbi:class I SAM-dependent methyltransferase [Algoriphagus sp.]|uniref:class I SAM-dependent methyltransferase n=1 Tax=Algoriphagus sp. TaxID=1872435 RepID=UPI002635C82A|nr:class I SAM-dependent methyltransferase [Algoriphagus sp.]
MTVLEKLEKEVLSSSQKSEQDYFLFHQNRYRRFTRFLESYFGEKLNSDEISVLDIGSHYLHSSVLLAQSGFQVEGMDVEEFWELDFVRDRGKRFGVKTIVENDLAKLSSFQGVSSKYDLIVFSEILEHITFNPILFWKTIYQILKPGGIVYISTPNAFAFPNLIRNLKNLFLLKSIGITVEDIFSKVTYGHHWKEYSAKEVKHYFSMLSDDFEVQVHPYHYKNYELKPPFLLFKLLSKVGNFTKTFADDLEVIVSLKEKTNWKIEPPCY